MARPTSRTPVTTAASILSAGIFAAAVLAAVSTTRAPERTTLSSAAMGTFSDACLAASSTLCADDSTAFSSFSVGTCSTAAFARLNSAPRLSLTSEKTSFLSSSPMPPFWAPTRDV